jgi:hypothetical protein
MTVVCDLVAFIIRAAAAAYDYFFTTDYKYTRLVQRVQ